MIFLDTESVGLTGPLVTIQWSEYPDYENVTLWEVWKRPVKDTLYLIESFCSEDIVGFNLIHDWFQLSKWYNIFSKCEDVNVVPDKIEIKEIEAKGPNILDKCLKPKSSYDLMIIARKNKYQYLVKHKSIFIHKVPVQIIFLLIEELNNRIILPAGAKLHWRVSEKRNYQRKDVKDIVGEFSGLSTSLKHLISIILNDPTIDKKTFKNEVGYINYRDKPDWKPWGGDWLYNLDVLISLFSKNSQARQYAMSDVCYTYQLWENLGCPKDKDEDSELAILIAGSHWRGFAVNIDKVKEKIKEYIEEINLFSKETEYRVNINSPQQVLEYIHEFLSPIEQMIIQNTKKTTLEELEKWENHPIQSIVKKLKKVRRAEKRINILKKLIESKRFYFSMRVVGTLSTRMSGGSENTEGSLNVHGIPREKEFRSLFTLNQHDLIGDYLEGGDFDAFEPTILDAIIEDEQFKKDLQSGLKIHLFIGSEFYQISSESILKTQGTLEDKYLRSKSGFLGWLYGAHLNKIAQVLDLPEEKIRKGYETLKKRYPQITKYRQKLANDFMPLYQPDGIGSKIFWRGCKESITSIFGDRRDFKLEQSVINGLYSLAISPPEKWKNISGECRRSDRVQTIYGAVSSAVYSTIFALQAHIFRAAANHEIQSVGARITKKLQYRIWEQQPIGIHPWVVQPLNIHDEILCVTTIPLNTIVNQFITEIKTKIPLLKIKWKQMKHWGDK